MSLFARKNAGLLTALVLLSALMGAAFWLLHGASPEAVPLRVLGLIETQSTALAAVATNEPTPASMRRIPGPGEVEICGRGIVAQSDVENPLLKKQFEQRQAAALAVIQQRLMASINERDRVASLMLQTALLPRDDLDQANEALNQNCGATQEGKPDQVKATACVAAELRKQQAVGQQEQRMTQVAQQLVAIARTTTHPTVYAQAVQLCANFSQRHSPPECGSISLTQWSRLDPNSMEPWLWALERAQQQKDPSGAMEALYQASRASYSAAYTGFVAQRVFEAADESNEVEQAAIFMPTMNLSMGSVYSPFRPVLSSCSANEVIDANRRQVCEDLADRLLQSDSLIGRVVGAAVGERIGWAPERIAALRDERRVLEAVSGGMTYQGIGHGSDGQMPQDCGAFRVLTRNALLNNWVRSG